MSLWCRCFGHRFTAERDTGVECHPYSFPPYTRELDLRCDRCGHVVGYARWAFARNAGALRYFEGHDLRLSGGQWLSRK